MSDTAGSPRTYPIGQVVKLLRQEFPDLTVSKVRFLESAGLIAPRRKESGYRLFTDDDVRRLRRILILQRDHFMPLAVIKEKLESGEDVALAVEDASIEAQPAADRTRDELARELSVSPDFLDELERFGLVVPRQLNGDRVYSADDAAIAALARQLATFGLEPRHLKIYENFVGKEALAFEQILFPMARQKGDDARENARKAYEALLRLSTALRGALLRRVIRQRFPDLDL